MPWTKTIIPNEIRNWFVTNTQNVSTWTLYITYINTLVYEDFYNGPDGI